MFKQLLKIIDELKLYIQNLNYYIYLYMKSTILCIPLLRITEEIKYAIFSFMLFVLFSFFSPHHYSCCWYCCVS